MPSDHRGRDSGAPLGENVPSSRIFLERLGCPNPLSDTHFDIALTDSRSVPHSGVTAFERHLIARATPRFHVPLAFCTLPTCSSQQAIRLTPPLISGEKAKL